MLVLQRQINESIVIGDDIEVVVVAIVFGKVKLGIKAPADVAVHRREIYQNIHGRPPDPGRRSSDQCAACRLPILGHEGRVKVEGWHFHVACAPQTHGCAAVAIDGPIGGGR